MSVEIRSTRVGFVHASTTKQYFTEHPHTGALPSIL